MPDVSGSSGTEQAGTTEPRHIARQAAAEAFAVVGRDGQPLPEAHYIWLHDSFCAYVQLRFRGFVSEEQVGDVVTSALTWYLAELYVRTSVGSTANPEDLFVTLDDLALGTREELDDEMRILSGWRMPSESLHDEELVAAYFHQGVTADAVREALAELRLEGERQDFLIVAQYLSMGVDASEPPDFQEVAASLCVAQPAITAQLVKSAIFRFCNRLPWAPADQESA